MTAAPPRACSWDNDVSPGLNFYVRGNAEEVLPGVVSPFAATYFGDMDSRMSAEITARIGVTDLLPSFPPPVSNFISFMGGRCVLNLAWANAIIATWTTSEGSGLMGQFLTTDQVDVSSGALADRERAAAVQRTVYTRFWPQCVAAIDRHNKARVGVLAREQAAMDLPGLGDRALWRYAMRLPKFQSHILTNHIGCSGSGGEFASILGKLLAAELGERFEESMVAGLTTGPARSRARCPASRSGTWAASSLRGRHWPRASPGWAPTTSPPLSAPRRTPTGANWPNGSPPSSLTSASAVNRRLTRACRAGQTIRPSSSV